MLRMQSPARVGEITSRPVATVLTLLGIGVFIVVFYGLSQTGAKDDGEEVYDIGVGITPPRLLHRVEPVRPNESKRFRVEGKLLIGLIVTSKGLPRDVHIVQSLDNETDQAAIEAVEQWTFEPARSKDKPVAVRLTVEIQFHER